MSAIADKIRKIIAKADSSTHPEEAAVFMDKAQRMMEEHGLNLLDLGRLDSDDPVGVDRDFYRSFKTTPYWEMLAYQVAEYFGCKLVVTTKANGDKFHTIAGRESARITHTLMWPFVMRQIKAIAVADYKAGLFPHPKTAYRDLAIALAIRVQALNAAKRVKRNAEPLSQVNALVPVDLIQQALMEVFPNMRQGSKAKTVTLNPHAAERAKGVSLNLQTRAPRSALKIGG